MREKLIYCTVCVMTGAVLPMALLIAGGILSVWSFGPVLNQVAAYTVALGLILMVGSYFMHRITTTGAPGRG